MTNSKEIDEWNSLDFLIKKKLLSTNHRGYKAYYVENPPSLKWYDNDINVNTEVRPCKLCNKFNIKDGENEYDACLEKLPGVKYACCGHGLTCGYILFENGIRITTKKMTNNELDLMKISKEININKID